MDMPTSVHFETDSGWPRAVVERNEATVGVPSVAFAVGGIPEVVTSGEHGLLVPFPDADAMAAALESILTDPVRRAALGDAARIRAREQFSAAAIVPHYEDVYRRVCA
jgi:glycosyltransferase involved in cell wall biosynthesis